MESLPAITTVTVLTPLRQLYTLERCCDCVTLFSHESFRRSGLNLTHHSKSDQIHSSKAQCRGDLTPLAFGPGLMSEL